MPLNISEGYYHGCHFEARPVLRRRVHFHLASGVRGLWLGRNRNPETSQLCFGVQVHLAPHFVKTLTLLVHSFANCVMWCKLLWFLDCGCSRGGAPRPSFLLHDSRSRRVPLPDQLPFFCGALFWLWNQKQPFIWCFLCSTLCSSVVNGICLLDPTLFRFLADSENSDRCLPAFIPF